MNPPITITPEETSEKGVFLEVRPWDISRGENTLAISDRGQVSDRPRSVIAYYDSGAVRIEAVYADVPQWVEERIAELYNAGEAVSEDSKEVARRLLFSLGDYSQPPDVYVDEQGYPIIEWFESNDFVMNIAVSGDGRLYYAARYGSERTRGIARYSKEDDLPLEISQALRRVLAEYHASS